MASQPLRPPAPAPHPSLYAAPACESRSLAVDCSPSSPASAARSPTPRFLSHRSSTAADRAHPAQRKSGDRRITSPPSGPQIHRRGATHPARGDLCDLRGESGGRHLPETCMLCFSPRRPCKEELLLHRQIVYKILPQSRCSDASCRGIGHGASPPPGRCAPN
jgi:hypothetical protein